MTQADTKRAIADYVNHHGQYAVIINIAGIPIKGDYTRLRKNPEMSGLGDVLICWLGQMIQVEVKRNKKESLRKAQEEHERRSTNAKGLWWTVTGIDDFIIKLEFYRKSLR